MPTRATAMAISPTSIIGTEGDPAMRLLLAAVLVALLCAACSSATLVASQSLTDEEWCAVNRGMWRAGVCQACGGGM